MQSLIITILCILAMAKVAVQSAYGKSAVKTTQDAILFNTIVFTFSALIFLPYLFNQPLSVIIFGAIFGFLTVIFQLTYIQALSMGAVSLTAMIVNLNMLIPIAVSAIVYKETVSLPRLVGIILTVIAFVVCTDFGGGKNVNAKWFLLTISASLADGINQVNQKVLTTTVGLESPRAFVAWGYLFAVVFSVILYFVMKTRDGKRTVRIKPGLFVGGLMIGVILGVFQAVNTYAVSVIDGTLLFPVFAGGSIVCSALLGIFIFKDRLLLKQKVSIVISVVAIVLMNM